MEKTKIVKEDDYFLSLPEVFSKESNVFRVFGITPTGHKVSVRVWQESAPVNTTLIGFRIRVGDKDGKHVASDFDVYKDLRTHWTSSYTPKTPHRSTQGTVSVPVKCWEQNDVLAALETNGSFNLVFKCLLERLPFHSVCSQYEFNLLMRGLILQALADCKAPEAPPLSLTEYLYLGPASSPLIVIRGGKDMIAVEESLKVKPGADMSPQEEAGL